MATKKAVMKNISLVIIFLFLLPVSSFTQNIIADFPFNGNALDQSGNGNNGTPVGATLTKGRRGNENRAYYFDGESDYIDAGNDASLTLVDGYSISTWFKSTGVNTFQTIVSKGYGEAGTFALTLYDAGGYQFIRFFIEDEAVLGSIPINNEWNHVVLNMQTGTDNVKVYLNGDLYLTHTTNNSLNATSTYNLRIGNNQKDEDYFFKGAIDDVKVFNKVLSFQEIQQLSQPKAANLGANIAGFGNALRFDGIDDYAVLPRDAAPDNNRNFTFETWVNWNGPDDLGKKVVIWAFGQTNTHLLELAIADGYPSFSVGSGQNPSVLTASQKIQLNQWQHLALSYDSINTEITIYLDGINVGQGVFPEVKNIPANTYHTLGLDYVSFEKDYFTGALDETRLWSETRSAQEIYRYRLTTTSQVTPGLAFLYNYDKSIPFGDNTANSALEDLFGNVNGNLSSFQLNGTFSNYISSQIGLGQVVVNHVNKSFYLPGDEIDILGTGFLPGKTSNKLQLGDLLIPITSASQRRIRAVIPMDYQTFGTNDLIVGNAFGTSITKGVNILYPDDAYAYEFKVQQVAGNLFNSESIATGDLDGDGDDDIVTGFSDLYWIENLGNDTFGEKQIIKSNIRFQNISLSDLDEDGDIDIVTNIINASPSFNTDQLVWFENEGILGFNSMEKLIFSKPSDAGSGGSSFPFEIADIDRDGYNDVVGAEQNGGIAWYKNPGMHQNFIRQEINNTDRGIGVGVVDFDKDGDIDVVAGVNDANDFDGGTDLLYLNNGQGVFGDPIIINQNKDANTLQNLERTNFAFSDFNGDGKMDVVSINVHYSAIIFQEDQSFSESLILDYFAKDVAVADSDGDGDDDFFLTYIGGRFEYYENKGDGSFEIQPLESAFFQGSGQVATSDMDNDGDVDVIFGNGGDGVVRVFYHINTGKDFLNFQVQQQIGSADINDTTKKIDMTVPNNFPLGNVIPRFQLDFRASASVNGELQNSGTSAVSFEAPQEYMVRSESGVSEVWEVALNPLPGLPQKLEVDDITQTQAEVDWESSNFTDSYEIQVSDEEDSVVEFTTSALEYIIPLAPGKRYAVRVRSKNAFGFSADYTPSEDFTTVPANPVLLPVQNIEEALATIRWEENQGTDLYLLEISTDSSFSNYLPGFNPATIVGTNTNTTIANLEDGTTYYARLRSRNNDNESGITSGYSEIVSFRTVLKIPSPPLAREASAVGETSFTANWDGATNSKEFSYRVEIALREDFQSSIVSGILGSNVLSLNFTNLQQYSSYWYRIYTVNESGLSAPSNTIFVKKPLLIRNLRYDSLRDSKVAINDTVSFEVVGGKNDYAVGMSYRGILTTDWTVRAVDEVDGRYLIRIRDTFLDEIGGEFEIYVNDGADTVSNKRNFVYWSDIESQLPNLNLENKWQLFSIPYIFEDNDNLIETIFDEMGPFRYKKEWRLMQYNGNRNVDAGSGINRITIGEGYWFYSLDQVEIGLEKGVVNTKTPFRKDLDAGWNQIGNPFNIPISWNSIRVKNQVSDIVDRAIGFDEASQSFFETDNIEPFSGAFVWADESVRVDISLVDNKVLRIIEVEEQLGADVDANAWKLPLHLLSAQSGSPMASIGMHPEASSSKDQFDQTQIPRFVNYTEMYTEHSDYFYPWFKTDIKPTSSSEAWLFSMESNEQAGINTMVWDQEALTGKRNQLWLIDEQKGVLIHMNTTSEYSFNWQGNYKLSFHLTASIDEKPVPFLISIGDPYPNPNEGVSQLNLALPNSKSNYTIEISLLDIQGKLLDSFVYENIKPGFTELPIELSDEVSTHSGVYFCQVRIVGDAQYSATKKIMIKN
jgi:hypothetical protein